LRARDAGRFPFLFQPAYFHFDLDHAVWFTAGQHVLPIRGQVN
jgi:hypothetical protein